MGSQATVERTIGEVGHQIRSKKSPFANLANIIYKWELLRLLVLYFPSLDITKYSLSPVAELQHIPHGEINISKKEQKSSEAFLKHLNIIHQYLGQDPEEELKLRRWGKVSLLGGITLQSLLIENQAGSARHVHYFEAYRKPETSQPIFGEALAFYEVVQTHDLLIVYHLLANAHQLLRRWRGA